MLISVMLLQYTSWQELKIPFTSVHFRLPFKGELEIDKHFQLNVLRKKAKS